MQQCITAFSLISVFSLQYAAAFQLEELQTHVVTGSSDEDGTENQAIN